MNTEPHSFILRFTDVDVQPDKLDDNHPRVVRRLIGTVEMKQLLPLFNDRALDPNPRSARTNRVTNDIIRSLSDTPDLFPNKSKGILLGTAQCEALQRSRFRLVFQDPELEGILDGGHNMLAIGLFMLQDLIEERDWKRIKSWDDLMEVWPDYQNELERRKEPFTTLIPTEILIPSTDDPETVEVFTSALIDICSARNNNAQLPLEAAANKKGYYDEIKKQVPPELARRTEWKPNTWEDDEEKRPVKVRDLVSLAWIPLNLLSEHEALPVSLRVTPQNIYRNKGECSKLFDELMSSDSITQEAEAARRVLVHKGVRSAFKLTGDLPALYDQIYEEFPDAYNSHNRRFRANPIVKLYDPEGRAAARRAGKDTSGYIATHPVTPFFRQPLRAQGTSKPCSYPDGLIMPLVYGLQGIMDVVDGEVQWAVDDPSEFVREFLPEIAGHYQLVLTMANWDPQKIAKNPASHEFAVQQFQSALRTHLSAA